MRFRSLAMLALLGLCAGVLASCGCGDDDDDDNDSGDDAADDDDATDDDAADDDAADDDAADDDAADDDAADDDAADDDDDATDDDDDNDDDDWNELFAIDFESYDIGDLPAPWVVNEAGNSYVDVVNDPTAKPGKVMNLAGDANAGSSVTAAYPVTHAGTHVAFVYDVWLGPTAWSWVTLNYGTHLAAMIVFNPAYGQLQVDHLDGLSICGAYDAGAAHWFTVRADVDLNAQTIALTIGGVLTDCTAAPLHADVTYTAIDRVEFADWGGAGEGGADYYDNFYGCEAD